MNNQSPIAARLARGSVQLPTPMQVMESTKYSALLQGKFEAYVTKANRSILCEAINALQNKSSATDAEQYTMYCGYCRSLPTAMGVN